MCSTNVDAAQRTTWIRLAGEHGARAVMCVYLTVSVAECERRLLHRKNHPTLGDARLALQVHGRFVRDLVPPCAEEGFGKIFRVVTDGDAVSTIAELTAIAAVPLEPAASEPDVDPQPAPSPVATGTSGEQQADSAVMQLDVSVQGESGGRSPMSGVVDGSAAPGGADAGSSDAGNRPSASGALSKQDGDAQ